MRINFCLISQKLVTNPPVEMRENLLVALSMPEFLSDPFLKFVTNAAEERGPGAPMPTDFVHRMKRLVPMVITAFFRTLWADSNRQGEQVVLSNAQLELAKSKSVQP
jgi:hypothetical protein